MLGQTQQIEFFSFSHTQGENKLNQDTLKKFISTNPRTNSISTSHIPISNKKMTIHMDRTKRILLYNMTTKQHN